MAQARPKPRYDGKEKPPFGDFLDWLDRQATELLGANYGSVLAAINGIVLAAVAAIDLSAIEAELADHEARIADLEAADDPHRSFWVSGRVSAMNNTANVTSYAVINGRNEGSTITTQIKDAQLPIGLDCTLSDFSARILTSSGNANTFTLAVDVNGSPVLSCGGMAGTDLNWHDAAGPVDCDEKDLWCISKANDGSATLTDDIIWKVKVTLR